MAGRIELLGAPPGHLPPAEVACWAELVGMLPTGTLRRSDRWMVEIGAYVLNRWRAQGLEEDGVVLVDCLQRLGVMARAERVN